MTAPLEELVQTLLFEGYALYPYTPASTKNATPTPFGLVYPPACAGTGRFDKARMQGVAVADGEATLTGEVRFLRGREERRLEAPGRSLASLAEVPHVEPFAFDGLQGRVRMSAEELGAGRWRVMLCVHNTTEAPEDLDRAAALERSLISTHPILRVRGGRFLSPLDTAADAASVNTFPVLATDADDVLLGATIVLPDHPQLAPESRGSLFDGTEIEEALLLHVMALSDDERAQIERDDPRVKAMIERAAAATPDDVLALHGRTVLSDPTPEEPPGERRVEVDGVTYALGAKVVLRLEGRPDPYDQILNGRVATIERIYYDYEDKLYFGVTVDDDPGQELMRDTGRFLFFFVGELEVRAT